MNILMVLENSYPPDERVENEIEILLRDGVQITLVCTKRGGNVQVEKNGSLSICRIPVSKFIYKSSAVALELPFYFQFWYRRLYALLKESKFDAIHLHDLPLVKVCARLARKFNLPLISDYHENRPEIMKMYSHVRTFPGKWLISVNRWLKYQSKYTQKTDYLILVTDEARNYYIENYKIDPQKIRVLPNYIALERFKKLIPDNKTGFDNQKSFTVVYFGDTGFRRGTKTILESAEKLKDNNIRFLIIGTSREHNILEKVVNDRKLNNVTFTGWIPPVEAIKLISKSNVGLCPFLRNIHHDTTYANKMFQYMALGKPVIVSDCTAQANFVKKENCGLVFEAGNSVDLCNQILRLTDEAEYNRLSRNAGSCVLEKYNWEAYGKILTELYSNLQKK